MDTAVLGRVHLTQSLGANTFPRISPSGATAIFLDVSPKGQVEPDFSERLFVAVLSFTDLLKSLLNPFLFPGSALLGVMNDLRLSPPGTPGNLAFGDVVSCGVGKTAGGSGGCLLCPAGAEARPLDSAALWFLAL